VEDSWELKKLSSIVRKLAKNVLSATSIKTVEHRVRIRNRPITLFIEVIKKL
jgi:hypothetical protein